ncbi:MAG TPA: hypothetical protein VJA19_01495 [Pseudomonas sp.]|nr:hypothetical protein [Pseudomonas sp.]
MHGSGLKGERHSTPDTGARPLLWKRVLGSLVIFGFLVGMMLGRLMTPDPVLLRRVTALPDALQLDFSAEPKTSGEHLHGAVVLRFEARGRPRQGQLQVAGKAVNWRVSHADGVLLLNLVAARPLRGEWRGAAVEDGWRLTISLREE